MPRDGTGEKGIRAPAKLDAALTKIKERTAEKSNKFPIGYLG